MLKTTDTFNPYTDARRCGIRVSFELVDLDAANTASVAVSDECGISNSLQTHNQINTVEKKYATLEEDYWKLDGSFNLPEEGAIKEEQTGWWSEAISDEDCYFANYPTLNFAWSKSQPSVGFTLHFDEKANQYPTRFRITAYDEYGEVIKRTVVENDSPFCEVLFPVENYRLLVFEMIKTSEPHRRVRVAEVTFGVIKEYTEGNIVSATMNYSFSPMCDSLPTSELTVTVDNADAAWNMANPEGIFAYLQQSQPLDTQLVINGERVDMGRFFFAKAEAEDDSMTAKITAYDKVYWLDTVKYRGGCDGVWTFGLAIDTVLKCSGLNITYTMPDGISSREVGTSLPQDISCREAICKLALAARVSVYMDRNSNLVFFDPVLDKRVVDTLTFDVMHSVPKITVGDKVNIVELTANNEYKENASEVFIASDVGSDAVLQTAAFDTPVAVEGQAVANWLLEMKKRRLTYAVTERGNPAREIGDKVVVYDGYGGERRMLVIKENYTFDGGLSCDTEVWG